MKDSAKRTRRTVTVAVAVVGVNAAQHGGTTAAVQSLGCPPLPSGTVVTESTDDRPTRCINSLADAPVDWKLPIP